MEAVWVVVDLVVVKVSKTKAARDSFAESGVEENVIRGWLGHVSLDTTNRYAEINIKMKQDALEACGLPSSSSVGPPRKPIWQSEPKLLEWLAD